MLALALIVCCGGYPVPRFLVALLLAILLPISSLAQDQSPSMQELWSSASQAYRSEDHSGFFEAMEELDRRRPYHFATQYNSAIAHILTEDMDGAIAKLSYMAELGLSANLVADEDFAALRVHPDYEAVAAHLLANDEPLGQSQIVHYFDITGALPEGVALDQASGALFISTVRSGKILRVAANDEITDFVDGNTHPAMGGILGMAVDNPRGLLWAAVSMADLYRGANEARTAHSSLFAFDLNSGAVRHHFELEGEDHFLGEVMLSPEGEIYASDSGMPILYRVADDLSSMEPIPMDTDIINLQGFDFGLDGRIYLADYLQGIFVLSPDHSEITALNVVEGVNPTGIDGLFFYEGALIGIQNATRPQRIVRFVLSDDGNDITATEVLVSNHPLWDEPTLGQVVGDQLIYNGTSGWGDYTDAGDVVDDAELDPIRIMSVDLN